MSLLHNFDHACSYICGVLVFEIVSEILFKDLVFELCLNRIEGGQSRRLSLLLLKTWLNRFKTEQSLLEKQQTNSMDHFAPGSTPLPRYCPLFPVIKDFQHGTTFLPPTALLYTATLPTFVPPASSSSFPVCCTEAFCSQNKDEMLLSKLFTYASMIPLKLFHLIWQLVQEF